MTLLLPSPEFTETGTASPFPTALIISIRHLLRVRHSQRRLRIGLTWSIPSLTQPLICLRTRVRTRRHHGCRSRAPDATLERFPSLTWNWRTQAPTSPRYLAQALLKLLRRRAVQARPPKILSVSLFTARRVTRYVLPATASPMYYRMSPTATWASAPFTAINTLCL